MVHYVYRYAEGNSVPSSEPWLFATSHETSDELELTLSRLKADTDYTLEVATQAQNGATGAPRHNTGHDANIRGASLHPVRAQFRRRG